MNIVRAKIKLLDQIDPKLLCCEAKKQLLLEDKRIFEVDLNLIQPIKLYHCDFCKSLHSLTGISFKELLIASYGKECRVILLEYIDLEEATQR